MTLTLTLTLCQSDTAYVPISSSISISISFPLSCSHPLSPLSLNLFYSCVFLSLSLSLCVCISLCISLSRFTHFSSCFSSSVKPMKVKTHKTTQVVLSPEAQKASFADSAKTGEIIVFSIFSSLVSYIIFLSLIVYSTQFFSSLFYSIYNFGPLFIHVLYNSFQIDFLLCCVPPCCAAVL